MIILNFKSKNIVILKYPKFHTISLKIFKHGVNSHLVNKYNKIYKV